MSDRTLLVKFEGKVDPSLEDAAKRTTIIATGIGTAFGTLAAKGIQAGAEAAKDFLVGSIGAASELAESTNVTTLVFGKQAEAMKGFFAGASTSIGMSEAAARSASANVGGLLQNMGFANKESADWSQTLLGLSADMGSAFNKDPAQAIEAIGAGLRGEAEPLKAFNVFLSDAAVKSKAVEMGLYSGKGAIDNHAKAQASLALIMEQTSKVQGDFANTANEEANASRIVAAQTEDLQAKIGTQLLPVKKELLQLVSKELIPAFSGFTDNLKGSAEWVQKNSEWLIPLGAGLGTVAGAIALVSGATKAWALVQGILNAVMLANPIGLVVVAIAALAVGLVVAYNSSETFRKGVDTGFKAIGAAGAWLWNNALAPMVRFILNGFADMVGGIGGFLEALGQIPGFGWAADAGRMMRGAAADARGLAQSIRDIPSNKVVTVTTYNNHVIRYYEDGSFSAAGGLRGVAAGGILNFAGGGRVPAVLPGYTPGRDVHSFWSPKLGRLNLSGGEGILRPEAVRVLGSGWLYGANAAAAGGGETGVRSWLGGDSYAAGGEYGGGAWLPGRGGGLSETLGRLAEALDGRATYVFGDVTITPADDTEARVLAEFVQMARRKAQAGV